MSVYDESPRWSDESVSDTDDAAEMTIRRPLFENNFLQRWIERDGEESEHEDDDEDDEDDPGPGVTKRFRSTFKRLFPKLAETSKSTEARSAQSSEFNTDKTEAKSFLHQPVSEVEINIPHTRSEWMEESGDNNDDTVELVEIAETDQNNAVANETTINLHEDDQNLGESLPRTLTESTDQDTLQVVENEPDTQTPIIAHIAIPLAAVASSEITNPNKQPVQPEAVQSGPAQKSETKTQDKSHKESWYQRFRRKRKERKVHNRLHSLEKQVKTLEDDTSKLRKKNAALQIAKAEHKPSAVKEMLPLQAVQHTLEKRGTHSHQEAPLGRGVQSETTPKPPRQAEIKAPPEKSIKEVPPEKPEKADRPQRSEAVREQARRDISRQEQQPDLEIIDDNIREAEFDKRHEIMDAQVDAKLSYEQIGPHDELPPIMPPERAQPRDNTSMPTPVGKILKEKEHLKQQPIRDKQTSDKSKDLSYTKATSAGFVFAVALAVIGLVAYVLMS